MQLLSTNHLGNRKEIPQIYVQQWLFIQITIKRKEIPQIYLQQLLFVNYLRHNFVCKTSKRKLGLKRGILKMQRVTGRSHRVAQGLDIIIVLRFREPGTICSSFSIVKTKFACVLYVFRRFGINWAAAPNPTGLPKARIFILFRRFRQPGTNRFIVF